MDNHSPRAHSPPVKPHLYKLFAFSLETSVPRRITEFLTTTQPNEDEGRKHVVEGFIKKHKLENIIVHGNTLEKIISNNAICLFRYPVMGTPEDLERSFWMCMVSNFSQCLNQNLNAQLEDLLKRLKQRLINFQRQQEREAEKRRKEKLNVKK